MKMKKIALLSALAAVALLTASCDSKLCYCYTRTSNGVYVDEVYTATDKACTALNTSSRTCVEQNEYVDPGDVAYANKRH